MVSAICSPSSSSPPVRSLSTSHRCCRRAPACWVRARRRRTTRTTPAPWRSPRSATRRSAEWCSTITPAALKLLVKRHRDLGRLKNKSACRLHALLMELEPGGMAKEMTVTRANEILDRIEPATQMAEHRLAVARETLADIVHYETQMKASMKRLRTAVAASGTSLVDIRGVGVVVAAMIIGHTGDIARFASAAHFASYNATAPIEASSGENKRHRLNQRGNRQLNWAIHVAAVTQLRQPCAGREYYDRKRAEGKNSKEAIRALKRQLSNVIYRSLVADARRLEQ